MCAPSEKIETKYAITNVVDSVSNGGTTNASPKSASQQAMKAGIVWANTFNRFDPTSPFGGYRESGFGREGGMHGLHAYVRLEDR